MRSYKVGYLIGSLAAASINRKLAKALIRLAPESLEFSEIPFSPGAIGTAIAQQSLRSVLSFCNSPQMTAPEAYIRFTPGMITDDGEVTVEATESFLRNYMTEFHAFIERVMTVLPRED